MNRVLFLCIMAIGVMLHSCNYSIPSSKNENTIDNKSGEEYPPEVIEWANQYHFSFDTTRTYDLDIKVFQTLGDYECLAHENSDKRYKWYNGQLLYYMTSSMVYDEKIIKEKAYLIGTYHYVSKDSTYRVVPFYCNVETFKDKKDSFEIIKEIQNY